MKSIWIEEQRKEYERFMNPTTEDLLEKLKEDAHNAIDWLESGDLDSAYRLFGGIAEGLMYYRKLTGDVLIEPKKPENIFEEG